MTQLAKYLSEHGLSQAEFAATVESRQSFISRLANGVAKPSLAMAVEIERATGGAVPVESWVSQNERGAA